MSKVASQYLLAVEKRIHCSRSQKKEFLHQLEDEVFLFCEMHDDVDINGLSAHFGSPEELADEFLSELGVNAVTKSNYIKKNLLYATAIAFILATALIAITSSYAFFKQQQALDGHYIEAITYEEDKNPYATAPTSWEFEFESTEYATNTTTSPN